MPSRFGSPRGSIPRILREAGEISDARMRSVQKYLDDFTATDDPKNAIGGGVRLTRRDFAGLLQQSPDFQQQVANRWVFATPKEREALIAVLREAFPERMAAAVGQVPGGPIPPEQQGTGLGGAPQGAAPVGPQPAPGAAPPGLPPEMGGTPLVPAPTMPAGPPMGAPGPPGMPATLPPPALGLGAATLPPGPPGPGGPPGSVLPGMPLPAGLPPPGTGPLVSPVPPIGPAAGPPPGPRPSLAAGLV